MENNDELSQWCEIDGHEWINHYFSYGLVLGPKTIDISRICIKCKKSEYKIIKPIDDKIYYNISEVGIIEY